MYISPIQEKLTEIVRNNNFQDVLDFLVENGANRHEITDAYHAALWIEGAPVIVKIGFLDKFNEEDDPCLRVCDHCGVFMDEGYLLDIQYACSDACAIALFDGDEKLLRETIGDGSGDFFWTQWY